MCGKLEFLQRKQSFLLKLRISWVWAFANISFQAVGNTWRHYACSGLLPNFNFGTPNLDTFIPTWNREYFGCIRNLLLIIYLINLWYYICQIDSFPITQASSWSMEVTLFNPRHLQDIAIFWLVFLSDLIALVLLMLASFVLFYCISITTFNTMSIGDTIYTIHWYQLPCKEQAVVRLIIRRSQVQFQVRAIGMIECSLETYSKVKHRRKHTWRIFAKLSFILDFIHFI